MNRTAAKLLNTYATTTGRSHREVKRWWKSLSWQERTAERKRIEEELGINNEDQEKNEE